MDVERTLDMQGNDEAECSPPLISKPPSSSNPPAPPPVAKSPWYRRCRAKLFLSFTSTIALLTALIYFGAESKVVVAAFDAGIKQLVSNVGNSTFESWTQNLTEVLTNAVRSASFGRYVTAVTSNTGQPDDG